jgi:hypothetical protein
LLGIGLGALLTSCGVQEPRPARPASPSTTVPGVRITTTGATFSPTVELVAGATATVSWEVENGATVSGLNPTISFGTEATRHIRMTVHDNGLDALGTVTTFNLGFNHRDDVGKYTMGPGYDKKGQAVTRVENISRLTGLRRFAAAHTPLAGSLDFTGCSRLQFIECYDSRIQSVDVTGCTSLIRLVVEQTDLTTLNLKPVAANLRDLRAAAQQGGALVLTPLNAPMTALYHFCVRGQTVVNHPTPAQLPSVEERWDWNTDQSGTLTSASGAIRSLLTHSNHYTTADLANQFPAGRNATLNARTNNLTAVNLTGCNGLIAIDLSSNSLNTAAVDALLAQVASWGTSGDTLNFADNSSPSTNGLTAGATLTRRGWTVTTDT